MSPDTTTIVLLAAGHGTRMLPLTANTPKPLLKVGELSLIEHHLSRLKKFGFMRVVINTAYLGEQISAKLGSGQQYGLDIHYSDESRTGALETAGGIKQALPLIESDPFLVINADIWTDFDFRTLLSPLDLAGRLVMVQNPAHNPKGDFEVADNGFLKLINQSDSTEGVTDSRTFSGIGLYKKNMFEHLGVGKQALAPVFRRLIEDAQLNALNYDGEWTDVGTPERLQALNKRYKIGK